MAKRILLARHAETPANKLRFFQGQTDTGLTLLGRKQARALGAAVSAYQPQAVFASDLGRARETVSLLDLEKDAKTRFLPQLREKSYGELEGVPWTAVSDWKKYHADPYQKAKGGESMLEVAKRLLPVFRKVQSRREETILIVTHHNPLAILVCDFLGMHYKEWRRFKLSLAGLTEVVEEEGIWRIAKLNDTAHLGSLKTGG